MRLGVLDVGSNTVHLLVVDALLGAQPTPQLSRKSVLRLSEHIDKRGDLAIEGADALVGATLGARRQATELECEELLAFATSAVRDAGNSAEVLDRVREEAGVELAVLTGEDEATLTFLAVAGGSAGAPAGCSAWTSAVARWNSGSATTRCPRWRCRCRWAPAG